METATNETPKTREGLTGRGEPEPPTPGARPPRPVKVKTVRDARRLLSRLIYQMQKDEIETRKAKDITYVLSVYIDATRDEELERRIVELERLTNDRLRKAA